MNEMSLEADNPLEKNDLVSNENRGESDRTASPIPYAAPDSWIEYDVVPVLTSLCNAKAAVLALTTLPFQRSWAEHLQEIQLKHEVAGTSKIEGADFTDRELDEAISNETPEEQLTRSQRQARAAVNAYRWIAELPDDLPVGEELILETHRRLVTGCDDDHCEPGALRPTDYNVTFGIPRHRGALGGKETQQAFAALCHALATEYRGHDILVQGLALHYHIGSMHPFGDGNGRTARAVETLFLQRAGLKDQLFIALSNYYYDEKTRYLRSLANVRSNNHNLTEFLLFGLEGIQKQCERLSSEIKRNLKKTLYRDLAHRLFSRLKSSRKRVIAKRQLLLINYLLENEDGDLFGILDRVRSEYNSLKDPMDGYIRDLFSLRQLGAVSITRQDKKSSYHVAINLDWPTQITETKFFETLKNMPRAKTSKFMLDDDIKDSHN